MMRPLIVECFMRAQSAFSSLRGSLLLPNAARGRAAVLGGIFIPMRSACLLQYITCFKAYSGNLYSALCPFCPNWNVTLLRTNSVPEFRDFARKRQFPYAN